jgi:predicted anti-sigma-YlaC factor YlaD
MRNHIQIDRAWILIQEGSFPFAEEAEHLEKCSECREFLQSFVSVAQHLGFSVNFPTHIDSERAA